MPWRDSHPSSPPTPPLLCVKSTEAGKPGMAAPRAGSLTESGPRAEPVCAAGATGATSRAGGAGAVAVGVSCRRSLCENQTTSVCANS